MSPFSSISSDKNADTTEILQLNVLLQTSAPESNEPEYFSLLQFKSIFSKSRRVTALSAYIRCYSILN